AIERHEVMFETARSRPRHLGCGNGTSGTINLRAVLLKVTDRSPDDVPIRTGTLAPEFPHHEHSCQDSNEGCAATMDAAQQAARRIDGVLRSMRVERGHGTSQAPPI